MNNLESISNMSQSIVAINKETWLPIYYSPSENEVYTEAGEGRYMITNLINPNTPDDIREAIDFWKKM